MDTSISRSSALSKTVQLIFYMDDINGTIFLKASFLLILLIGLSPSAVILPFTTICATL